MLVGKTERRDIPHEDGEWIEFRQLSGVELDEAEEAQTKRSLSLIAGLDEAALGALRSQQAGAAPSGESPDRFDKTYLLRRAVTGWSYPDDCTLANVDKLDAATRDWAVGVVLEMNTRPLASTPASGANSNGVASLANSGALTGRAPQE